MSKVSDRLEAAANSNKISGRRSKTRNLLEKYTEGPMPPVQDITPTSIYNFIDIELIRKWEVQPGKIIVIPFNDKAYLNEAHESICNCILTLIAEITKSQDYTT
ncbi:hypothetical protein EDB84DRAFT_1556598 [Lactarius hengduanensis]|nr:hypothetical protein EDB84DRAFT_1556598 [Lactarius hengduanensis]